MAVYALAQVAAAVAIQFDVQGFFYILIVSSVCFWQRDLDRAVRAPWYSLTFFGHQSFLLRLLVLGHNIPLHKMELSVWLCLVAAVHVFEMERKIATLRKLQLAASQPPGPGV